MTEPTQLINLDFGVVPVIDPISTLADLRKHLSDMKQKKLDMVTALENNPEYKLTLSAIKDTETLIEGLACELKEQYLSLVETDETGKVLNPNPHPAVTFKRFDITKVVYESKKAFQYCLNNLTTVLDLNTKEFEKQAKTGKLPDEIVEVIPGWEVRVQLATDLSKFETPKA